MRHSLLLSRRHTCYRISLAAHLPLIVVRVRLTRTRCERWSLVLDTGAHRRLKTVLRALVLHHMWACTRRASVASCWTLLHVGHHVRLSVGWHGRVRLLRHRTIHVAS